MNRSWPGTSTMLISWPFGSVSQAKPRSIVIPRSFSSWSRSGSIPVSALISVDFPWSTWPAVPTTRIDLTLPQRFGQQSILLRQHRSEVQDQATTLDPSDDGQLAMTQAGGQKIRRERPIQGE